MKPNQNVQEALEIISRLKKHDLSSSQIGVLEMAEECLSRLVGRTLDEDLCRKLETYVKTLKDMK